MDDNMTENVVENDDNSAEASSQKVAVAIENSDNTLNKPIQPTKIQIPDHTYSKHGTTCIKCGTTANLRQFVKSTSSNDPVTANENQTLMAKFFCTYYHVTFRPPEKIYVCQNHFKEWYFFHKGRIDIEAKRKSTPNVSTGILEMLNWR